MKKGSVGSDSSSNSNNFENEIRLREKRKPSYTNIRKEDALIQKHISSVSKAVKDFHGKDEEYWEKKEFEHNKKRFAQWDSLKKQENVQASNEAKDLKSARKIRLLTIALQVAVIFTGIFNFYSAMNESFHVLGENMRLEYLRKRKIHNCDAFLVNLSILNDMVHLLHGFFSAALLFANSKENGTICVFWIFSQAAETCLFLFITSYNLRFHELPIFDDIAFDVFQLLAMDIFGTICILLRYYQLTNPYTERKSKLHAMGSKKVLNFEIVFVHLPQFLQDKVSFRQAANYETMMILKNLYGDKKIPIEKPNKLVVDKEVDEGLDALKAVSHYCGIKKLRELKLRRQNRENQGLHNKTEKEKKKFGIEKIFQQVLKSNEEKDTDKKI